nr:diacylglycerol kinase family protein [uncultured Carboxylicivirga sp.]
MQYLKKRVKSFTYALKGIFHLVKDEPNARIHIVATIIVVIAGFILKIKAYDWLWIGLAIILVFITEIINTSIENLADAVTNERNDYIGKAKDLGAAATLLAALFAVFVASVVLYPKVVVLF